MPSYLDYLLSYGIDSPERVASKVILVDGPLAGSLHTIPTEYLYYRFEVPREIRFDTNPAPSTMRDAALYAIRLRHYVHNGRYIAARIGSVASYQGATTPGQPTDADLNECGPTGLAEQGLIPWGEVPDTALDEAEPLRVLLHGDPMMPCHIQISDPCLPSTVVLARCACGWCTEYGIPVERRAQVVRAAHRHAAGEYERRRQHLSLLTHCDPVPVEQRVAVPEARDPGYCHHACETIQDHACTGTTDTVWTTTGPDGAEQVTPVCRACYDAEVLDRRDHDWPAQGSTCAHVCGPDPGHVCDAAATTQLTYKLPSGGQRSMPLCQPCYAAETAEQALARR